MGTSELRAMLSAGVLRASTLHTLPPLLCCLGACPQRFTTVSPSYAWEVSMPCCCCWLLLLPFPMLCCSPRDASAAPLLLLLLLLGECGRVVPHAMLPPPGC